MIVFDCVPFHIVAEEIARKSKDYPDEFDLDWDYYLAASFAGKCFSVVAREGERFLGGAVYFIETDVNNKKISEANNSVLFLDPSARGRAGRALFKEADKFLKKLGVKRVNYSLKDDRIGHLTGGAVEYKIWSKDL